MAINKDCVTIDMSKFKDCGIVDKIFSAFMSYNYDFLNRNKEAVRAIYINDEFIIISTISGKFNIKFSEFITISDLNDKSENIFKSLKYCIENNFINPNDYNYNNFILANSIAYFDNNDIDKERIEFLLKYLSSDTIKNYRDKNGDSICLNLAKNNVMTTEYFIFLNRKFIELGL